MAASQPSSDATVAVARVPLSCRLALEQKLGRGEVVVPSRRVYLALAEFRQRRCLKLRCVGVPQLTAKT